MDPIMGMIILFAGDFIPKGWYHCDGRLLSIANNSALFSILGTTYGGDGVTTFALPDLRGRVAISQGTGPGLSTFQIGEASGTETNTLLTTNLPAHNHMIYASSNAGESSNPEGSLPAAYGSDAPPLGPYTNGAPNTTMAANTVSPTGSNSPVNNMQPFLTLNYIIAYEGIYPSRG